MLEGWSHLQLPSGQPQDSGNSSSCFGQSELPSHSFSGSRSDSRPRQVAHWAGSSDVSPHSDTALHQYMELRQRLLSQRRVPPGQRQWSGSSGLRTQIGREVADMRGQSFSSSPSWQSHLMSHTELWLMQFPNRHLKFKI